jgi:quinol-cytochrome oxidoreductase complex cytochrome b subunit
MLNLIQKIVRWFFMRFENAFNLAFGEKLNPFYHLGTISFWQFWLLIGTGLYLYIFADTAVHDAYESVERITHQQWWAGGIMRSIHRYATDGMILTMLLHMLRHFAYDRYRGFRWFSWAIGVALIWLIYISGLNGFMLVWDKLAQFVVIATAEWFDVLPMFNGTLIRNFIYQENVTSRLFTLLAFIHLGAPLIAGVLAWVHVQRVPRAHINPPRDIAIAFSVMFVVLALVKPVVSQGGEADMLVVPTNIQIDWFQMPSLALVYWVDPMKLWFGMIGLTLLLFLMPWLPPKRMGEGSGRSRRHLSPRSQDRRHPLRRNAARCRPAPRYQPALRMPQRRLRPVQMHGALRRGRSRPVSAERTVRRGSRRRQGPALLRHRARRRRNRIRGARGTQRHPPIHGPRGEYGKADPRRDAGHAQAAAGATDLVQGRAVHQHHPRRWPAPGVLLRQSAAPARSDRTANPPDARWPLHDPCVRAPEGRRRHPVRRPWATSRCANRNGRSSSSPAPPASRRSRAWSRTPSTAASGDRSISTGAYAA